MQTEVVCRCASKKESQNYNPTNNIATEIELVVPYDQSSIYYQMSGGTTIKLNTVNQAAADMFKIGKDYKLTLAPVE